MEKDAEKLRVEDIFVLKERKQNAYFCDAHPLILLTFDDGYMDMSINLILSVKKHNTGDISFVCICPELKEENQKLLLELDVGIQINNYRINQPIHTGRWPVCAILRVFSPWLLSKNITRVLYMDSDILCTGSIQELFDLPVPYIAMCNEISGNVSETQWKTYREICPTQIYCNSGVVIFNLNQIREDYALDIVFEECCAMCNEYAFPDQDFLNIFFDGKIIYMNEFFFNFQAHELRKTPYYKKALRHCALIHFSVGKPWNYKSSLQLILLYLRHSQYPPMRKRVKLTAVKSVCCLPVTTLRYGLTKIKTLCSC